MIKDSFEPITKNDVKYVTKRAQEVEEPYDLDEAYSSSNSSSNDSSNSNSSQNNNATNRSTAIVEINEAQNFTVEKSLNTLITNDTPDNSITVRFDTDGGVGTGTYGQSSFHKDRIKLLRFEQLTGADGKDISIIDEERRMMEDYNNLHQSINANFQTLKERLDSAKKRGGEPLRLGGEDEMAPDGNLRYPGLAHNVNIPSYPLVPGDFERKKKISTLTKDYARLEAWRLVAEAFQRGFVDRTEGFNLEEEDERVLKSLEKRGDSRAEEVIDEEDDAVCQVCFDGLATVSNEVLFCERCGMAVHQRCYGVPEIPEGDFFCDRCQYLNKRQKRVQESVFKKTCCTVCGKKEGAMKRARGGRWIHLFCAQWTKGCIINDPIHMTDIELPKRNFRRVPICTLCNKGCGPVLACSHPGCLEEYHPYCAWYAGCYMEATYNANKIVKDDSTMFIKYKSYCLKHTPEEHNQAKDRVQLQTKIRQKYLSKFPKDTFITDRKRSGKARKKRTVDGVERLMQMQKFLAEKRGLTSGLKPDEYKPNHCAVCLRKQKREGELLKCKICSIEVHRTCYIDEDENMDASSFDENNFKCYVCLNLEQQHSKNSNGNAEAVNVKCELCPRIGGAFSRTASGKWVHTFCASWVPGTHWINKACVIKNIQKSHFGHRCCICQLGGKQDAFDHSACVQCAEPGCYRKFHPLCAAMSNCFYTRKAVGGTGVSLYNYCPTHWPSHLEFNKVEGVWRKKKSTRPLPKGLKDLLAVRRDIDRTRTLIDVLKKRVRIERRIFDCEFNFFEAERTKYEPKNGPMSRRTRREQIEDKKRMRGNDGVKIPSQQYLLYDETADDEQVGSNRNGASSKNSSSSKNIEKKKKKGKKSKKSKKRRKYDEEEEEEKDRAEQVPDNNDSRNEKTSSKKLKMMSEPAKKAKKAPRVPSPPPRELTFEEKIEQTKERLRKRSRKAHLLKLDVDLSRIFKAITEKRDLYGEDCTKHFQHIPSDEKFPDYSSKIKDPISLNEIAEKIQNGEYINRQKLSSDIKKLVANARKYNESISEVYQHAGILEREVNKQMSMLQVIDAGLDRMKSRSPARSSNGSSSSSTTTTSNRKNATARSATCPNCLKKCGNEITLQPRTTDKIVYYCLGCLKNVNFSQMIIGREAHIYWPEDKAWYKAYIDTFHVESHGHRVLYYEDCNWEFVDFTKTSVFFTDNRKSNDYVL